MFCVTKYFYWWSCGARASSTEVKVQTQFNWIQPKGSNFSHAFQGVLLCPMDDCKHQHLHYRPYCTFNLPHSYLQLRDDQPPDQHHKQHAWLGSRHKRSCRSRHFGSYRQPVDVSGKPFSNRNLAHHLFPHSNLFPLFRPLLHPPRPCCSTSFNWCRTSIYWAAAYVRILLSHIPQLNVQRPTLVGMLCFHSAQNQ